MDDIQELRTAVAEEYGFRLARLYDEPDAAKIIGLSPITLARKRRGNLVPFVDRGNGSIGYLGRQLADILILGVKATEWDDQLKSNSVPANTGSPDAPILRAGSAAGTTKSLARSSVSAYALAALTKRNSC